MDGVDEQLRRLVEHLPDGFVILFEDRDPLTYIYAEGEGLDAIGMTKEQLEGEPVAKDRPKQIQERIRSKYRAALDGEEVTFEVDAEGRHYQIRLFPIPEEDGTIETGAGIVQDMTEQALYQEQLERYTRNLEEVTRLVSHDMRNPLSVAMGRLDVLREECDSEQIDVIDRKLQRIDSLIDDILSQEYAADIEDLEDIDIEAIATDAWQNVETKTATLQIDESATIEADSRGLRRLFENLYRNAVEHTDGRVSLRIGLLDSGFYLADDGPGIPPDERESVFERDYTNATDGTGLGLFIVRQIAERHGWRISVVESDDGGARFEIRDVKFV